MQMCAPSTYCFFLMLDHCRSGPSMGRARSCVVPTPLRQRIGTVSHFVDYVAHTVCGHLNLLGLLLEDDGCLFEQLVCDDASTLRCRQVVLDNFGLRLVQCDTAFWWCVIAGRLCNPHVLAFARLTGFFAVVVTTLVCGDGSANHLLHILLCEEGAAFRLVVVACLLALGCLLSIPPCNLFGGSLLHLDRGLSSPVCRIPETLVVVAGHHQVPPELREDLFLATSSASCP